MSKEGETIRGVLLNALDVAITSRKRGWRPCWVCKGNGAIVAGLGAWRQSRPCFECGGTGILDVPKDQTDAEE